MFNQENKNMCRIINITNHSMTQDQRVDAQANLGVMEELSLPAELLSLWGTVPPELDSVEGYVAPLIRWLAANCEPTDIVWTQGEWGAVLAVVNWCRLHKVRCVYATTARVAQEVPTDHGVQLSHVFKHVRFRDFPA